MVNYIVRLLLSVQWILKKIEFKNANVYSNHESALNYESITFTKVDIDKTIFCCLHKHKV